MPARLGSVRSAEYNSLVVGGRLAASDALPGLCFPVKGDAPRCRRGLGLDLILTGRIPAMQGTPPAGADRLLELGPGVHRQQVAVPKLGGSAQKKVLELGQQRGQRLGRGVQCDRLLPLDESAGQKRAAGGQVPGPELEPQGHSPQLPVVELVPWRELRTIVNVDPDSGPPKPVRQLI